MKKEQVRKATNAIKTISIFYYLGIAILVISILTLLFTPSSYITFIVYLIVYSLSLISCLFIARGLWKMKRWARIFAILFSAIIVILFIISEISYCNYNKITIGIEIIKLIRFQPLTLIGLIINLILAIYLLLNKNIRKVLR